MMSRTSVGIDSCWPTFEQLLRARQTKLTVSLHVSLGSRCEYRGRELGIRWQREREEEAAAGRPGQQGEEERVSQRRSEGRYWPAGID